MNCYKCNKKIKHDSVYCHYCGEQINKLNDEETQIVNDKSSIKDQHIRKYKFSIIVGILVLLIAGINFIGINSNRIDVVSKKQLKNVELEKYFPSQIGTKKYYRMIGDTGEEGFGTQEIDLYNENDTNKITVLDYSPLLDGELMSINSYQVEQDEIILFETLSPFYSEGKEVNNIILSKEPVFELEEEKKYITSIDKTIKTEAGVFEECIEVIIENKTGDKDMENIFTKQYFAPELGEVLTIFTKDINSDDRDFILYELTGYELPNNKTSSNIKDEGSTGNYNENKVSIEDTLNITEKDQEIIIEDTEFNFTMELPTNWKGKYTVEKENFSQYNINLGNTYHKTLDFLYTPEGLEPQYMFSLVVFDTEMLDGVVEEQVEEIVESAIAINEKYYLEDFTVPEPSQEIANNEELLSEMMVMVNEDLPKILETVKFLN